MPFIAPVIVASVGITAATVGTVGVAIATAAVGVGLSYGLSYVSSQLFAPDISNVGAVDTGLQLNLQYDSNATRQIAFGKTSTAGSLVYWQLSGTNNNIYDMVIALSDWPSNGLVGLFLNGKRIQLNIQPDGTYRVVNVGGGSDESDIDYGDKLKITFHNGDFSQLADQGVIDRSSGAWTSNSRGKGICYVVVTMDYDRELFPSVPQFKFEIEGAKLYDWRKDDTIGGIGGHRWDDITTWEYSNNPAVIYYNWRRGLWYNGIRLYGMTTSNVALDISSYSICANICDELVPLSIGGTEKRYTSNGVISTNRDNSTILKDFLMSMGGEEVETGGTFKLYAGAARPIVMSISSDDILVGKGFSYIGKKSGNDLINYVSGDFINPEEGYVSSALPPRTDNSDVVNDGQQLERNFKYNLVTSFTTGQRLMEMVRRNERLQATMEATFPGKFSILESGDWISFTDEQRGWTNRIFRINNIPTSDARGVKLSFEEISSNIYDWITSDEVADNSIVNVINTLPSLTTVSLLNIVNIIIKRDGVVGQIPALQFNWNSILDLTVDAILFEYRIKNGDGLGLQVRAEDPSSGTITVTNGVQGGLEYEVRAKPITNPARTVQWTNWLSSNALTAPIEVEIGRTAIAVAAGSISSTELDAQSNYELSLAAQVADGLGAAWDIEDWQTQLVQIEDYLGWEQSRREEEIIIAETNTARAEIRLEQQVRATENSAIAVQIQTVEANVKNTLVPQIDDVSASVVVEQQARVTADEALSVQLQTVQTDVGDNNASVQVLTQSIDGMEARWGVAVSQNGEVIGVVNLDGTNGSSTFSVLADKFKIAANSGGTAVPVFALDNTVIPPKLVFAGDFIADGTITADHLNVSTLSALSADLGTVTAGIIHSSNGLTQINLNTGEWKIG